MKVAIIGCGGIAQVHAGVLAAMPEHQVIACVDTVPEKAHKMAETLGARAYTDMKAMLEAEHPDAVHLCTPHDLHTPMASLAAGYGIAVFTEKPPVISTSQYAELKKVAEKVPLGICFQNRYNPNVLEAAKIIESGCYGRVLGVRGIMTWNRSEGYYRDDWHGKLAREGGGTLINQAIHTLDLMIGFLGEPDLVESSLQNHHLKGVIEVEDTVEIYMTSGNRKGILYASNAFTRDEPVEIVIHLEKAVLRLVRDTLTVETENSSQTTVYPEDPVLGKSYWGAGHNKCIRDFYRCLESGEVFRNNLESCAATIQTYLQVYHA